MRLLKRFTLLSWVLIPGCWALNGPNNVNGYIGGSLSVCCHYDKGYENNSKYWCKFQKIWNIFRISCNVLVRSKLDKKVKDNRISIQDNEKNQYFQVIMENLTLEDIGHYRCGIRRVFPDLTHDVKVTVYPAPTLEPEEGPTIIEPSGRLSTAEQEEKLPATEKPVTPSIIHSENTDESNTSPHLTPPDSEEAKVQLLIYCIVPLVSLLLLAAVVLVAVSRKKRTGSCLQRKEEMNMSVMNIYHLLSNWLNRKVSTHNTEYVHTEDTILDHPPDAEGTGLYRIVEVQPEYNYDEIHIQEEAVEKRDEDPYITLGLSDAQEQTIYDNMQHKTRL
ncbi:CMRF35-like molecule 6 isoform X2 [Sceloporus undulatus]|uniref:CMRF35-like molecule 6 isoform X2 n=1 Tax=Sceloporus undulatus TaxID=8520 RepID=UPI001C4C78E5|nr:CMRF35-like molecule 6 isoform X2 [Sceloporus undulatus]